MTDYHKTEEACYASSAAHWLAKAQLAQVELVRLGTDPTTDDLVILKKLHQVAKYIATAQSSLHKLADCYGTPAQRDRACDIHPEYLYTE